jgi:hypothetical protein
VAGQLHPRPRTRAQRTQRELRETRGKNV